MSIEEGYTPTEANEQSTPPELEQQAFVETPGSAEVLQRLYKEWYPNGGDLTVSFGNHVLDNSVLSKNTNATVIAGELSFERLLRNLKKNPYPAQIYESDILTTYGGIGTSREDLEAEYNNLHTLAKNGVTFIATDSNPVFFFREFDTGLLKQPTDYMTAYEQTISKAMACYALSITTGIAISAEFASDLFRELKRPPQTKQPELTRRQFLKMALVESAAVTMALGQARLLEHIATRYVPPVISSKTTKDFQNRQIAFEKALPDQLYKPAFLPFTQAILEFRNKIMAYNLHRVGDNFSQQHESPQILAFYGGAHTDIAQEFDKGPDSLKSDIQEYIQKAVYELPQNLLDNGLNRFHIGEAMRALIKAFPDSFMFNNNENPAVALSDYPSPKAMFFNQLATAFETCQDKKLNSIYDYVLRLGLSDLASNMFDVENLNLPNNNSTNVAWFDDRNYLRQVKILYEGNFLLPQYKKQSKNFHLRGYLVSRGNIFPIGINNADPNNDTKQDLVVVTGGRGFVKLHTPEV